VTGDDERGRPEPDIVGEVLSREWLDIGDPSDRERPREGDLPDDFAMRMLQRPSLPARLLRTLRGR
jgi:hypothetical protein